MLIVRVGNIRQAWFSSLVHPVALPVSLLCCLGLLPFKAAATSELLSVTTNRPPSFRTDVAPLLQQHCVVCHGPDKAKGRFRLDNFAALLKPGTSGEPTIVPGQPGASHLYQLLVATNADDRMPQKAEALLASQIATIQHWIQAGAKFDGPSPDAPFATFLPAAKPAAAPERYRLAWPVTALAFTPNRYQLVASGYREIIFWDGIDGTLLRRIGGMPERIRALAWQPGGSLLAVAGGAPGRAGTVVILDLLSDGQPVELVNTRDEMLSVTFSPDGARLAVGGADNVIRVFDVVARRQLLNLEQHSDWVHCVAFSPDGQWLASGSRDRTARVCDATTGETRGIFRSHDAAVEFLFFIRNGTSILSVGADRRARSWSPRDVESSKVFAQFPSEVTAVTSDGDSAFFGLADGRVVQRLADGRQACEFEAGRDRVTALAFQPESNWLATGSHGGVVRLWNANDGELLEEFTAAPGFVPLARR